MAICLVLAGYLLAGLITGVVFINSCKEVFPAMLEYLKIQSADELFTRIDIVRFQTDEYYRKICGFVFHHSNYGFLVLVMIWPLMATAMIGDAIYRKKRKKGGDDNA